MQKINYTEIKYKNNEGFTLIELLVVIAIISILSSIILASISSARARSRDAVRKQEMKQIQSALEMYYIDHNAYPSSLGAWRGAASYGGWGTGANGYIPGLVPKYISVLPLDPANTLDGFLYQSNGTNYKLLSNLSPESYPSAGESFYDLIRPTSAWMVTNKYDIPPTNPTPCATPPYFTYGDYPICW
ncbi:MAG: prepilin-type N-terminal cleavage/methylation domain-containing protein [Patescibacteria group bacterium]|nr:prepilin-type N-terminal cleavage/methylation domain-containing protein [Patescibacteria group bacterium]